MWVRPECRSDPIIFGANWIRVGRIESATPYNTLVFKTPTCLILLGFFHESTIGTALILTEMIKK
jgi:hypothetical protein